MPRSLCSVLLPLCYFFFFFSTQLYATRPLPPSQPATAASSRPTSAALPPAAAAAHREVAVHISAEEAHRAAAFTSAFVHRSSGSVGDQSQDYDYGHGYGHHPGGHVNSKDGDGQ